MHYTKAAISAFGYELPPLVVYSDELEDRLQPLYRALRFQPGQLEAITGIGERRFWEPGFRMAEGAVRAGRKALTSAGIPTGDIGMLIYAGVCRDNVEPATACAVCHGLGLPPETQIYDVSNACLGVLNGMVQVANAIELGQVKAGLVVSCESAREVVEVTIQRLNETRDMDFFKKNVATLTGGSGAVAVVLADAGLFPGGHRLLGGVGRHAAEFHRLCMWGPETEKASSGMHFIETDSLGILNNGVQLGAQTFKAFKKALAWEADAPDKIVCHQVGATHQRNILNAIGVPVNRDFTTFGFLGNIGSVSLPITAAIAAEREFLSAGDRVGFLGIGSGLNCLMLGLRW